MTHSGADTALESRALSARTIAIAEGDGGGRELLFFGGCSYLGLSHDERVLDAAARAMRDFGVSTSAARGTSGTTVLHREFEEELAEFAGAPAAALLPDAGLADLAVALAKVPRGARVFTGRDAHPCISDALAAAGATGVEGDDPFAARLDGASVAFTDGTFPSAARVTDVAALRAARFELLVIDDAHGFGVLGERGAGAAERLDLSSDGEVLVAALSKGLGAAGGVVCGSRRTLDAVCATSPFANTTALPPPIVAAARAALALQKAEPERRVRLAALTTRMHGIVDALEAGPAVRSTAFPVRALAFDRVGRAASVHSHLRELGVCVPLLTYPGGPAADWLRIAVNAAHTDADLDTLAAALRTALERTST